MHLKFLLVDSCSFYLFGVGQKGVLKREIDGPIRFPSYNFSLKSVV